MLRSALHWVKTRISIPKTLTGSGLVHRPLSSCTQSGHSSIVRDLTDTHGFPRETAEALASVIGRKRRTNYPSVLTLFRDYGFDHSDISAVVIQQPSLLSANAEKILKPKLDAFVCHGIEGPTLVQVVTGDPFLLCFSASVRLFPGLQCLYRFFGSTQRVVDLLLLPGGKRILHKFKPAMEGNIDILRENGVPDASITRLMLVMPMTLCRDPAEFQSIVQEIQELGMDTGSSMFIYGVVVRAAVKKEKWTSKVDVFKRFRWTDGEVAQLFIKQPKVMGSSVERIEKSLDYYLNQLGWTKEEIIRYPYLLYGSLQKRIIPRMLILNMLVSEGSVNKKGVPNALRLSNKKFVARYMAKSSDQTKRLLVELYDKSSSWRVSSR